MYFTRLSNVIPMCRLFFMTAHGSIDTAVDAMRYGAQDFLIKPVKQTGCGLPLITLFEKPIKLRPESK